MLRAADTDQCKSCASTNLFDTCIDRQGCAVTDGSGRWTTLCNDCGQDQNAKVKRRKSRNYKELSLC